MSNIDITSRNNKGERHGYWEVYYGGNLLVKSFYHNGKLVGYNEQHQYYWYTDGKIRHKKYHI